jgi:hypothetical protein
MFDLSEAAGRLYPVEPAVEPATGAPADEALPASAEQPPAPAADPDAATPPADDSEAEDQQILEALAAAAERERAPEVALFAESTYSEALDAETFGDAPEGPQAAAYVARMLAGYQAPPEQAAELVQAWTAATTAPTEQRAAWREDAERALVDAFGEDAERALSDARRLIDGDPRLFALLDAHEGLGNYPGVVIGIARLARAARAAGVLK